MCGSPAPAQTSAIAQPQSFGQRSCARAVYVVNQQFCYADLQRGIGDGGTSAARAEQDYVVERYISQRAPEAFGEAKSSRCCDLCACPR